MGSSSSRCRPRIRERQAEREGEKTSFFSFFFIFYFHQMYKRRRRRRKGNLFPPPSSGVCVCVSPSVYQRAFHVALAISPSKSSLSTPPRFPPPPHAAWRVQPSSSALLLSRIHFNISSRRPTEFPRDSSIFLFIFIYTASSSSSSSSSLYLSLSLSLSSYICAFPLCLVSGRASSSLIQKMAYFLLSFNWTASHLFRHFRRMAFKYSLAHNRSCGNLFCK